MICVGSGAAAAESAAAGAAAAEAAAAAATATESRFGSKRYPNLHWRQQLQSSWHWQTACRDDDAPGLP